MRLAVVGSRRFQNKQRVWDEIDIARKVWDGVTEIVTGDAQGVDSSAADYCASKGLDLMVFSADWGMLGLSAGPIRNQKIVDYADAMLAFPDAESRGTQDSIKKAIKKGIPVVVVYL